LAQAHFSLKFCRWPFALPPLLKMHALSVALVGAHLGRVTGKHGFVSSREWLPRVPFGPAVSADSLVSEWELPKDFDWRDVNGQNLVSSDVNQHIPQYCGSCWIHGTTAALNDRIKAMRNGQFPDVMLSRQALMNCVPAQDLGQPPPGCNGGDPEMIHHYLAHNKVPDESCMPYTAKNMGCTSYTMCRNCNPDDYGGGCFAIEKWTGYGVSSHGNVTGEVPMMKEIYARGPIVCSFVADDSLLFNYSQVVAQNEGVYTTNQVFTADDVDHNMEVAGWGETASGMKYWVVRNSWGTYWGSGGWLKVERGKNMLFSESDCAWAVPTFEGLDEQLEGKVLGSYRNGLSKVDDKKVQEEVAAPDAPGVGDVHKLIPLETSVLAATGTFCLGACVAAFFQRSRGVAQKPLLG